MEGERVRVVDDGSGNEPEQWNPAPRLWMAGAAALGVAVALVLLAINLWSTDEPPTDPLAVLPAVTTTTTLPTATVWRGVTYPATVLQAEVRSFCEQGAAMGLGKQMKSVEEWMASFDGTAIFGFGGSVVDHISVEATHARNAEDLRLAAVLESVSEDLTNALSAMGDAEKAADGGDIFIWTRRMFRVEGFCGLAEGTISTLVSVGEE